MCSCYSIIYGSLRERIKQADPLHLMERETERQRKTTDRNRQAGRRELELEFENFIFQGL